MSTKDGYVGKIIIPINHIPYERILKLVEAIS